MTRPGYEFRADWVPATDPTQSRSGWHGAYRLPGVDTWAIVTNPGPATHGLFYSEQAAELAAARAMVAAMNAADPHADLRARGYRVEDESKYSNRFPFIAYARLPGVNPWRVQISKHKTESAAWTACQRHYAKESAHT